MSDGYRKLSRTFREVDWVHTYGFIGLAALLLGIIADLVVQAQLVVVTPNGKLFLNMMIVPSIAALTGFMWRRYEHLYFLFLAFISVMTALAISSFYELSNIACASCRTQFISIPYLIAYILLWIVPPFAYWLLSIKRRAKNNRSTDRVMMQAQRMLRFNVALNVLAIMGLWYVAAAIIAVAFAYGNILYGLPYRIVLFVPVVDALLLYNISRCPVNRSGFAYFALTRALLLIVLLWLFYNELAYDAAVNGVNLTLYGVLLGLYIFFLIFCARLLFRTTKGRWEVVLLGGVCALSLFGIVGSILVVDVANNTLLLGPFGLRHDNQVSHDFQLLSQDIETYQSNNMLLPHTLTEAVDQPDSLSGAEHISGRLGQYTYLPDNSTKTFRLCATFASSRIGDEEAVAVSNPYEHKAGYQCIGFKSC